jgi:hypothetical protein
MRFAANNREKLTGVLFSLGKIAGHSNSGSTMIKGSTTIKGSTEIEKSPDSID